ncbi:hypothetical protein EVAR_56561_1 [Eumeta japonica]|uniref:Uncharacterized protein n=1 Tax=Eumeta variegata TaxID=151549 RepID=A0A4C1ZVF7_EUMVA|nr:hypothetical protein EVAR_56561_1 [Eumeta japonica]
MGNTRNPEDIRGSQWRRGARLNGFLLLCIHGMKEKVISGAYRRRQRPRRDVATPPPPRPPTPPSSMLLLPLLLKNFDGQRRRRALGTREHISELTPLALAARMRREARPHRERRNK